MNKKLEKLNEISNTILEMLKSKPEVKSRSEYFPNTHSGLYSQSNIIHYLDEKYTGLKICQGLNDLLICKEIDLRCIIVKNFYYEESYPYYYFGEFTTDEEAQTIFHKYETWSKKQAKEIIKRRIDERKKSALTTNKRKVSQKQLDALVRARKAKQNKKVENV